MLRVGCFLVVILLTIPSAGARACEISVTGTQSGFSNSSAVDCISISNANISGNINNTGSILTNGIFVTNSSVSGLISNIGALGGGNTTSIAGGIVFDKQSSVASGLAVIGVSSFTGGINSAATVGGIGLYIDSGTSFAGGITNSGATNQISVSNFANFSRGVLNSGQLVSGNYGIGIFGITNFSDGISNTGAIASTGVNRAGISLYDIRSFTGGITNSGTITAVGAGISLGDTTCACIQPALNFSGGISNSGVIAGGYGGIVVDSPTKFAGGIINSGFISGNTGLILFYGGAGGINVINSGTITGTGGTAIEFGGLATLTLTPTSVINGNVIGLGNNILQLGGSGVGAFDVSKIGSQYQGFGKFEKIDSTIWTLTGLGTFAGPVNVNGGTLLVDGSLNSASITTVNAGGTLGGTGTIGNTSIVGGVLAPGNNMIGTLTVKGSLDFAAAATYLVQISSSAASSANATGIAKLAGTVRVESPTSSYAFNSPYAILTSSGLASTQFNAISTPTGINGSLIYSGNSVLLDLTSDLAQIPGLNPNQRAAGAAFDAAFNTAGTTGPSGAIFSGNIAQNLNQSAGETATGSLTTTFDAMAQFMGLLTDPFVGERSGATQTSGASQYADDSAASTTIGRSRNSYAMFTKAPVASTYDPRWSVWVAGFGGSQTTDGSATVGSNSTTSGIAGTAMGADYPFSPNTMAGFALAGGGTSFSVSGSGFGHSDLFQAAAYVRHTEGAAYISAALAYGWQDIITNRTVSIAGIDRLRAEFNASAYSGRVESGYRLGASRLGIGITPYAAAQFTVFDLPSYAESALSGASTFALAYGAQDATNARSELGIRTDKSLLVLDGILKLRGRLAWAHDYTPNRSIAATFQSLPGASFVVNGAAQASDSVLTSASIEMKCKNGWSAATTFEAEFSSVTASYAGKAMVRYEW